MRFRIWYSPPSFLLCGRATAIFARFASKNRKFCASKKPTVGFFLCRGFVNDLAPKYRYLFLFIKPKHIHMLACLRGQKREEGREIE